ncbi:SRPBCC family protein [Brevibacillus choshinensis]|uniref:SRPBCC family protein n=1 Tax=Brevibacillus choshinensis TaxID=54911 RepID=A0ABX7FQ41_BRECH|nr:SRPBCC family protein [Brevibacillus choshinensis]QRG67767.1 SRPBCC family protein [Brevibacillus choshinensis]
MPVICSELIIAAPPQLCFDAARSIDLHMESTSRTGERAIAGVMSGWIELGESVTWEAVHFGIKQRLTAKITEMNKPHYFVDEMVSGAFKRFRHEHEFIPVGQNQTRMLDTFDYTSPLGILGKIADWLFLEAYMARFLLERNLYLKQVAERQFKQTEEEA